MFKYISFSLILNPFPYSTAPCPLHQVTWAHGCGCRVDSVSEFEMHSRHRVDEFLGLDRRRVDDLVDVSAVAVGVGGGDVDEGLQVLHLLRQREELLCGDDVQLQRMPAQTHIINHRSASGSVQHFRRATELNKENKTCNSWQCRPKT